MKRNIKSVFALVLCLVLVVGVFAGCKEEPVKQVELKQAAYNTTTKTMPSNWNEFTYADNNDTQIMSYIGSSFFEYDYKFEGDKKYNADGSVNKAGIVPGAYTTNYSAATKLEDVTSLVDAKWGYTAEQKEEGGYAWKITLRDDLKWDDGTAITAADFEWSMQQLLDPKFMNFRANTYYDTQMIKNSKGYFFQNQEGTYESVASQGFANNAEAVAAGFDLYVRPTDLFSGLEAFVDKDGKAMPEWITGETLYATAEDWEAGQSGTDANGINAKWIFDTYGAAYLEVGCDYQTSASVYVENKIRDVKWEDVGIYAVEGENAIVLCLDKAYSFLKEDGSLSVWAPYYFSSLPVVHKAKYEASKIAPAEGATLWTSN